MKTKIFSFVAVLAVVLSMAAPAKAYDVFSHKKNFDFGYTTQSIKGDDKVWNSDWGVNLEMGRTIFLHRKPIANLFKIGLDINFNADYAKFTDLYEKEGPSFDFGDYDVDPGDYGFEEPDTDIGMHQVNVGVALGPSFVFALPKSFRAMAYFHVIPSWSVFIRDGELNNSFVPYFAGGVQLGWKAISVGYEFRGGKGNYNRLDFDSFDYDDSGISVETEKVRYSNKQSRIYVAFHF